MKKDFWYILIIFVLAILFFRSCQNESSSTSNTENNIEVLNDTIKYFNNKLGQEVAEKKAFQLDKKTLLKFINENKQLKMAISKFSKFNTVTQITTETKIDTLKIVFKDSIPCSFEKTFEEQNKNYSISGVLNNQLITFSNITIPNEQSVVIGKKNLGFFKNEFRVEVTNSNPLIKVKEVNAYNIEVPKKHFGIGITGAYGLGKDLQIQPFIGIGINYNILTF